MSLEITRLQKDGDATQEYILLKAMADVNIGDYAIVDRTFNKDGKLSNIHRHLFWFTSKLIKKGEYVSLRTGKGTPTEGKLTSGEKVHRYYWGSDAPFWNDGKVEKAVLIKITTIDTMAA